MKAKGLWATIFLHECFAIESGIALKLEKTEPFEFLGKKVKLTYIH